MEQGYVAGSAVSGHGLPHQAPCVEQPEPSRAVETAPGTRDRVKASSISNVNADAGNGTPSLAVTEGVHGDGHGDGRVDDEGLR